MAEGKQDSRVSESRGASALPEGREALPVNGRENLWARAIAMETGIQVASCYQCLRCTNSCPVNSFMDIKPHQVVRFVQLGQRDRLLGCSSIWVCLSCEMCTTYCPNEIDVASLLNHLKNEVIASQRQPAEFEIATFHHVFLEVLEWHGRINDLQLMQRYRGKTMLHGNIPAREELFKELGLAFDLWKRGRLKLLPERSGAASKIRRIVRHGGPKGGSR